jgi:hypothetical protein
MDLLTDNQIDELVSFWKRIIDSRLEDNVIENTLVYSELLGFKTKRCTVISRRFSSFVRRDGLASEYSGENFARNECRIFGELYDYYKVRNKCLDVTRLYDNRVMSLVSYNKIFEENPNEEKFTEEKINGSEVQAES